MTAVTTAHADVQTKSLEERADELVRAAELVVDGAEIPSWMLRAGLREYVSGSLPDSEVTSRFEALVEAVAERKRFTTDSDSYAVERDFPPNQIAFDHLDAKTQVEVDDAVWSLLNPTPVCMQCRRSRCRKDWRPALYPTSVFCASHRPPAS